MSNIGRASVVFESVGADKVRGDIQSLNQEMQTSSQTTQSATQSTNNLAAASGAAAAATALMVTRTTTLSAGLAASLRATKNSISALNQWEKQSYRVAKGQNAVIDAERHVQREMKRGVDRATAITEAARKYGMTILGNADATKKAEKAVASYRQNLKQLGSSLNDTVVAAGKWVKVSGKAVAIGLALTKTIDFIRSSADRSATAMRNMAERVGQVSREFSNLDFGTGSDNPFDAIKKQADDARKSFFDSTQALRNEAEEFMRKGPGVLDAAIGLFTTSNYQAQAEAYNRQLEVLERRASAVSKRIEDERQASLLALRDQTMEDLYKQRVEIQTQGLDEIEQAEVRAHQNQIAREKEIQELRERGQWDIAEAVRLLAQEEEKRDKKRLQAIKDRQAAEKKAEEDRNAELAEREAQRLLAEALKNLNDTLKSRAKLETDIRDQMISLNNSITNFAPSIEKIGDYAQRIY